MTWVKHDHDWGELLLGREYTLNYNWKFTIRNPAALSHNLIVWLDGTSNWPATRVMIDWNVFFCFSILVYCMCWVGVGGEGFDILSYINFQLFGWSSVSKRMWDLLYLLKVIVWYIMLNIFFFLIPKSSFLVRSEIVCTN